MDSRLCRLCREGVLLKKQWFRRPQVLIAAGIFVLTLTVYVLTLNPTTPFWDAGEFITTSHIVGVPHQPGTPMYVLVGRVFDIIFGQADITTASMNTAWAVNFMSAFFSALAVMFIYLLIWEIARRADPDSGWLAHVGGVVGAMFLAFSETFWNNAVEAEVYGLSAFIMACLSWLTVRWYDHREQLGSNNLLLLMIYMLGLGVGFHLGSVLVYPSIFLVVLLATRRQLAFYDLMLMSLGLALFLFSTTTKNNDLIVFLLIAYVLVVAVRAMQGQRFAMLGSALFFVGLTVHFMMMVRAGANPEPYINQTDPDTFASLMSVIRREQYPPINPFERQAPLVWQFGFYYNYLFKQFYFLGDGVNLLTKITTVMGPIFLALVGLFQGLRRVRPLIYIPLVSYLINGEILTLYLNFTDHEVRDRDYFYFAAFMFFAVFIGLGAAALLRYVVGGEGETADDAERAGRNWRLDIPKVKLGKVAWLSAAVLLVVSLWPLTPGHTKYFEHDNSDNRIAYEYAWNIMAGLDHNAIIFTNGDNDTFPIWYLQQVEKFRNDVTVVNLSLINLPWYIKQLKNHPEHPLEMQRTNAEIDALRHKIFEDPKTGERQFIMIKDYVVHDIITTNYERKGLPVFFAVTIPRDNMSRYFAKLKMEGMAYRLTETDSPDGSPITDAQKVLENMLGVYSMDALLDGDSEARHRQYQMMSGLVSDTPEQTLGQSGHELSVADLDTLLQLLGKQRTDVFRNKNAAFLLGNYPAALSRAGYEAYMDANAAAPVDSVAYQAHLARSLIAFAASLIVEPFNQQALEFYPLLLVQAYKDEEAMDFLSSLAGNVEVELEERMLYNALRGFVRGGVPDLAFAWLALARDETPERRFYYQLEFALYQESGRRAEARKVMDSWEVVSGEVDPEMQLGMDAMGNDALQREEDRIKDAVEGGQSGED